MTKKYIIKLSEAEQEQLKSITTSGTQRVRKVIHANILLNANACWPDQEISQAQRVSVPTIERVRQRFVEEGLEGALTVSSYYSQISAFVGWRPGSTSDCSGLWSTAGWTSSLELAFVGQ